MDNKKDNQLSTLHRSYGETGLECDISKHGPFGNNYACANAYKKTERLLIALHLVTNFVPEKEPARNAVRDKSICILSDVLQLRSGFRSVGSDGVGQVVASVYEIMSLLDILHVAGFISDMNLEILKRELGGLIIFLREAEDTEVSEKVTFDNDYFKTGDLYGGVSKRHNIKDTTKAVPQSKGHSVRKTSHSSSHTERRAVILDLMKNKNSVNVKDISAVITDCSEKTLQRELISLVKENVLKKEGERRWSVYSIR